MSDTLLEQVIRRLRARVPVFQQRIAGMADAQRWSESRAQDLPFGFVYPTGTLRREDHGGLKKAANLVLQRNFRIKVFLSGAGDRRNQQAATDIEGIEASIMRALHGWQPMTSYHRIAYVATYVGQQSGDYSEWIFDFAAPFQSADFCSDCGLSDEDLAALGKTAEQLELEDWIAETGHPPGYVAPVAVISPQDCQTHCDPQGVSLNLIKEDEECPA